jgi:hypothetical protein
MSGDTYLLCPIRRRKVKQTPEELVRCRQRKLHEFLPRTHQKKAPNRRIDILCYSKKLEPLLLIECKKKAPSKNAISQILGYNYYIGAPFVALVSSESCYFASATGEEVSFSNPFPPFEELLNRLSK